MSDTNVNLGNIPTIWTSQVWINPSQNQKNLWKPDISMFDNAPSDVTTWSFFGKIFIWIVVWICVAALLFATLSAIWWLTWSSDTSVNSMLWILLPVIWFVVGFVWNLALAWLYNIFFSKRYYNFGKMAGLIFASSLIIFVFFVLPYFLYKWIYPLYALLWFQIIFELFIAKNLIDFLSQPNYSASSLMWNTLWAVLAIVVHIIIISQMSEANFNILFIIASAMIAYIMTVIWSWIWDAIYYKFYEWWNNPFYLPSLNELREERRKEEIKKAKDEEEVNVDIK